ncbi:hypothetical protein HPB51_016765 [Rhipicephalus microplus]|uniref:Uncharacterized protein n=1 Tax=Rhipicephalus microplus TaxID=6941 RepID=A0A9J6DAP6_RHIMP|nr:hypothetical protein HPB51_016765 [Rhipicephalus microplus]
MLVGFQAYNAAYCDAVAAFAVRRRLLFGVGFFSDESSASGHFADNSESLLPTVVSGCYVLCFEGLISRLCGEARACAIAQSTCIPMLHTESEQKVAGSISRLRHSDSFLRSSKMWVKLENLIVPEISRCKVMRFSVACPTRWISGCGARLMTRGRYRPWRSHFEGCEKKTAFSRHLLLRLVAARSKCGRCRGKGAKEGTVAGGHIGSSDRENSPLSRRCFRPRSGSGNGPACPPRIVSAAGALVVSRTRGKVGGGNCYVASSFGLRRLFQATSRGTLSTRVAPQPSFRRPSLGVWPLDEV